MKFFCLLFMILLSSCGSKDSIKPDIVFEIQNKELSNTNMLNLKMINSSKKDYFFCFDTTSIYFDLGLDYKINELIHPRPVFDLNDKIIDLGYSLPNSIIKPMFLDTAQSNCIERNIQYREEILKELRKLKKIILLKRNTSITLNLPFNNSRKHCNQIYTYIREEGSCKIQFKYKMNKEYFDKIVDKKLLLELQHKKFKPYFEEIISNKIPYKLK